MKINPININDLINIDNYLFKYERIKDLSNMSIDDIENGWIVVTRDKAIFIMFDYEHSKLFFNKHYYYECRSIVEPNENKSNLSYILEISYKETFPKNHYDEDYDIVYVYKTNIDIDMFDTLQNVIEFYDKYKIIEIINEDLQH